MWKSLEDNFVTIVIFLAGIILSAGRLLQKYSSLEKRIEDIEGDNITKSDFDKLEDRVKQLEENSSQALLLELKFNLKNLCEAMNVKYIEVPKEHG